MRRIVLENSYLQDRDVDVKIIRKLIFMYRLSGCGRYLSDWTLNLIASFLNLTVTLKFVNQ
jgi:hypothetical protein